LGNTISLVVCKTLEQETRAVIEDFSCREVSLSAYGPACSLSCSHLDDFLRQFNLLENTLQSSRCVLLGGNCIKGFSSRTIRDVYYSVHGKGFCAEFLIDPAQLTSYVKEGYYVVTPGWLRNWKFHIEKWGFNEEGSKDFFKECSAGILLLDTGIDSKSSRHLEDFKNTIGLPVKTISIGYEYYRNLLNSILLKNVLEEEREDFQKQNDSLSKRVADYAMMCDLFQDVIYIKEEHAIIEQLIEIISMMTAAKYGYYGVIKDSHVCEVIGNAPDDSMEKAFQIENGPESQILPGKNGYYIKIRYGEDLVGILAVEEVMFPEYLERYLGMLQGVSGFIGLAVGNARSFDQIQVLVDDLRNSNLEISQMNKKLEQALESAKFSTQKAISANQSQSRFIANVSHEIRTPLHGIMGILELLKSNPQGESNEEYILLAEKSGKLLLSLINELIDAAKIEAGKMTLDAKPLDLIDLIHTIFRMFKNQSEKKDVKLLLRIEQDVPEAVMGDSNRITQILNNMISNAIKFTEEGEIEITVGAEKDTESSNKDIYLVKISVRDTGIGIPEDKIEEIFNPFSQIDTGSTKNYDGAGLGLSISKNLARLMNGDLHAESKPGEGSVFTLELPLQLSKKKPGRVLIVEDDRINGLITRMMVNRFGYSADIAKSGKEAVEKIKSGGFDLILMDCYLPDIKGYEAVKKIRGMINGSAGIPVIATSAAREEELLKKCRESGMVDHLSKPFTPKDLEHILQKWILKKK